MKQYNRTRRGWREIMARLRVVGAIVEQSLSHRISYAIPSSTKRPIHGVILAVTMLSTTIILWQVAADLGWINQLIISSPERIIEQLWSILVSGGTKGNLPYWGQFSFYEHYLNSLIRLLVSYLTGVLIGFIVGVLSGSGILLGTAFTVFVTWLLNSIPKIAIFPLIIFLVGIGAPAVILLVTLIVFTDTSIATHNKIANDTDQEQVLAAAALGFRPIAIVWFVAVPGSLLVVFASLRRSLGAAIAVLVVTEWIAASSGIGALLSIAQSAQDPAMIWALLVVLVATSAIGLCLLRLVRNKLVYWPT